MIDEMCATAVDDFKENTQERLEELKNINQTFINNSKYLCFQEDKLNQKRNELENYKIKIEEENKENFAKYQVMIIKNYYTN